ncbi:MAG: DUF928 domain-containing protein [Lautropia sp.]
MNTIRYRSQAAAAAALTGAALLGIGTALAASGTLPPVPGALLAASGTPLAAPPGDRPAPAAAASRPAVTGRWFVAVADSPAEPSLPRYVAPGYASREPPVRILGSTNRGTHDESLSIAVIAPDHVGLTATAQPTLYWFASNAITGAVELTIQDETAEKPLVETRLRPARDPGLIAVRLSELGASLAPGRDYRWSISVIGDPNNRSKDVVTSGFIRRTGPATESPAAGKTPAAAGPAPSVFSLAENGLWYDAIALLGEQIARSPNDPTLQRQRAALLRQVGLDATAEAPSASAR